MCCVLSVPFSFMSCVCALLVMFLIAVVFFRVWVVLFGCIGVFSGLSSFVMVSICVCIGWVIVLAFVALCVGV